MVCEKHYMDEVDIIKGGKVIGVNHFCKNNGCNHEYDGSKFGGRR